MTATEPGTGVAFTLDGQALEAKPGELLIEAAERHGVHIPRFCYHPRMKPVGMCRMCLVEVDAGRGPALQPSCMLTVTPDMVVNTTSETTTKAQDGVLELFLINHPLDCPVCDKGGECPLQDNAYAFGPGESRFVEEKRHYEKPIPISDLVHLDRERCILCDRCTRFASDVAGDPLIHFIDRGNETQVNTFPDHPFASYFSGNTVQACPVGALTAAPYRFKARPWDLTEVESTSVVDSTGARVALQSSRDELVRILGVDSDAVNWGWLSDKERFAYEATNSEARLTDPQALVGDEVSQVRWDRALGAAAEALSAPADKIGVIGGARLPLEAQFAWSALLTSLGVANVDAQLGDGLPGDVVAGLADATIAEAAAPNGVVVLLSADPKEELPTLYLRLRHAAIEDGASLVELTARPTGLSGQAAASLHPLPGAVAEVAAALADGATGDEVGGVAAADLASAHGLLTSGRPVTIVLGRANLAESPDYAIAAVAALKRLAPEAKVLSALRRGNIHGALEMGLTPELDLGATPAVVTGLDTEGILEAAAAGKLETLVLLGADPIADFPDTELARKALDRVSTVVAIDTLHNESVAAADVVLPASAAGEVDGAFLNLEGRLSPLKAKVTAAGQSRPDWMIAAELASALDRDLGAVTLDELRASLSAAVPAFADVDWTALDVATDGPLIDRTRSWSPSLPENVAVPSADGYGLRLVVDRAMWDGGTMVAQSASLASLPAEPSLGLALADFEALGIAEGAEVLLEVAGTGHRLPAVPMAGLPKGAARIPFNLPGFDATALLSVDRPVTDIRVTAN
ncbi:MAG: NADH-quinone oxidoreductase subunit NuoG [Acidimicrobiales bacterium]